MRKILTILISITAMLCFSGCSADTSLSGTTGGTVISSTSSEQTDDSGNSQTNSELTDSGGNNGKEDNNSQANSDANIATENNSDITDFDTESDSKILVAFFSRADENYGVGYIAKGNTHIIADMIADEMNADTFEIARVTPYPEAYSDCTDEAQREKNESARPELTATVESFDDYDIVFLGYPNWWGDMPMPVYTFIESYNFSGKTVIPFCTHAGSGLSGTVETLRSKLSGATVLDGLAMLGTTAQNEQEKAKQSVLEWIGKLNLS